MVQLIERDIKTREVLGWKGAHVLHYSGSSCSQKLRIFLNLKGIPWQSHPVDLHANENFTPWFLGTTRVAWYRFSCTTARFISRATISSPILSARFRHQD